MRAFKGDVRGASGSPRYTLTNRQTGHRPIWAPDPHNLFLRFFITRGKLCALSFKVTPTNRGLLS